MKQQEFNILWEKFPVLFYKALKTSTEKQKELLLTGTKELHKSKIFFEYKIDYSYREFNPWIIP